MKDKKIFTLTQTTNKNRFGEGSLLKFNVVSLIQFFSSF